MLRTFARNTAGRDLLVGDLHGYITKFRANLAAVGFDPARDRVFCCGDLVDRGPESPDALGLLQEPWFYAIRGNHETMAIAYAANGMDYGMYAINGGSWLIGMTPAERQPYIDAFADLPLAIELETEAGLLAMVHAECPLSDWAEMRALLTSDDPSKLPQLRAAIDSILWGRDRADKLDTSDIAGVLAVVVGHTTVERVTSLGNTLFIDTGAWLRQRHQQPFAIVDAATLQPLPLAADPLPA